MFLWEVPDRSTRLGGIWCENPLLWDLSSEVLQDGFLSYNQPFKQEPPFLL